MRYFRYNDKFNGKFIGNLAIKDYFQQNNIHVGQSINFIPKDYVIVDVETTGFQPDYDEIIDIACVKYRDFKEVDRFSSLVCPNRYYIYNDGYVDNFISELTGITNEMLETEPIFKSISDKLFNFLSDEIIVGHNVAFDIRFIRNYLFNLDKKYMLTNDYFDTLRVGRKLIDIESYTLSDLILALVLDKKGKNQSIPKFTFHRAMSDCLATQELVLWYKEIIEENDINIEKLFKPKDRIRQKFDLRNLVSDGSMIDKDSPFYNKNIVFTGSLEKFLRKEAAQIVVNIGGHCQNNVTKDTDFLIIGGFENISDSFYKSNKKKKVDDLIAKGKDIKIISETTFYDLISDID